MVFSSRRKKSSKENKIFEPENKVLETINFDPLRKSLEYTYLRSNCAKL